MATELNLEISRVEMERLKTSIKYHDWILGFVVVVGVSLSIYLIDAMNTLQEGLADVRTRIEVVQMNVDVMKTDIDVMKANIDVMKTDIDVMKADIGVMKADIGVMKKDIDTLSQKMDRYHGAGS